MFNGLNNKLANVPTITGLSDITADTVTADSFNGLASNASQILIENDNTANTYYIPFTTSGAGQKSLLFDTDNPLDGLSYQPSTSTLSATNFFGTAVQAIDATNAEKLKLNQAVSGTTFYLNFVDNATTGNRDVFVNSNLSYNRVTDTLTASNFNGIASRSTNLAGGGAGFIPYQSATNLTTFINPSSALNDFVLTWETATTQPIWKANTAANPLTVLVTDNDSNSTFYPIFASAGTGQKSLLFDTTTTPLSYNPFTSTLTANNFSGLASNATQVLVTDDNSSTTYYPTFTTAGTGQKSLLLDSNTTPLSYRPDNGTLTVNNVNTVSLTATGTTNLGITNVTGNLVATSAGATWLNGSSTFISTTNAGTQPLMRLVATTTETFIQAGATNAFGSSANIVFSNLYASAVWAIMNSSGLTMNNTNITLGASSNLILSSLSTTLTPTELSYLDGATSNIQAQINAFPAAANIVTTNTTQIISAAKTFSGVTTTFQTNAFSPNSTVSIVDTGTSNSINFIPNAGVGAYNFLTEAGDSLIMIGAANVGDLTIAPNSSTLSGIRLTPTTTFIGVGGASTTRTAGVSCSGSTVAVTGTLTATNLTGLASNATQVLVTDNDTGTTYYPTFTTAGTGQKNLLMDAVTNPLSYVPSTSTLTCSNFSGLASNATTSANIALTSDNTSGTYYIPFSKTTSPTSNALFIDNSTTPLAYNPLNNELSATQFSLGGLAPASGSNAGIIIQNTGSSATVIQNQATSGSIFLNTRTALNANTTVLSISTTAANFSSTAIFNAQNITVSGTVINLGQGAGGSSNLICGNTNSKSVVFTTGNNTVLGGNAGDNMLVGAFGNTFVGSSAGVGNTDGDDNTFIGGGSGFQTANGTGANNVCLGNGSGRGMITTALQNTFVGAYSGYQAAASGTGNNNTVLGYNSGRLMSGGGIQNTFLGAITATATTNGDRNTVCGCSAFTANTVGDENTCLGNSAGNNITGNRNISIGYLSTVPVAAGSNQIAIGTTDETMYIRGGFNWRVEQITNSTDGNLSGANFVLCQLYMVAMSAATQTITLPNPATAAYIGARVLFKRKTNTTAFTLTQAAGFLNYGAISIAASPYNVPSTILQVDLISDGTNWCVVSQR